MLSKLCALRTLLLPPYILLGKRAVQCARARSVAVLGVVLVGGRQNVGAAVNEAVFVLIGSPWACSQQFTVGANRNLRQTCRHSLGGALAILSAAMWTTSPDAPNSIGAVYTFGAPRVGDQSWADAYNAFGLGSNTFR